MKPPRPSAKPVRGQAANPLRTAKPVRPATDQPLDGEGRPYITLAQWLKREAFAGTGGSAKVMAREGGCTVNGEPENRPGRKLHDGDQVAVGGDVRAVVLSPA
jgi:ribosome-associated protein